MPSRPPAHSQDILSRRRQDANSFSNPPGSHAPSRRLRRCERRDGSRIDCPGESPLGSGLDSFSAYNYTVSGGAATVRSGAIAACRGCVSMQIGEHRLKTKRRHTQATISARARPDH